MQISLGNKGDYAVRAVLDLAHGYDKGRRKAREISVAMDIPQKYLPQVLGALIREGIVVSVAGPDGGYSLTRSPADVSLLEVVEAAEGPVKNGRCLVRGGPCRWEEKCAVHDSWAAAQDALIERLAGTTFAELVSADVALEAPAG